MSWSISPPLPIQCQHILPSTRFKKTQPNNYLSFYKIIWFPIFLGIICHRLYSIMAYNFLHVKIQLSPVGNLKKNPLFQAQQSLCLFVIMDTFLFLLQFTLSSFQSPQVIAFCEDLGISCIVMSTTALTTLTVLSKRKTEKNEPLHHVLVRNNKTQ